MTLTVEALTSFSVVFDSTMPSLEPAPSIDLVECPSKSFHLPPLLMPLAIVFVPHHLALS